MSRNKGNILTLIESILVRHGHGVPKYLNNIIKRKLRDRRGKVKICKGNSDQRKCDSFYSKRIKKYESLKKGKRLAKKIENG